MDAFALSSRLLVVLPEVLYGKTMQAIRAAVTLERHQIEVAAFASNGEDTGPPGADGEIQAW
jgi:hypothetical protein